MYWWKIQIIYKYIYSIVIKNTVCHKFEKKYEIMANKTFIVPILFFFNFCMHTVLFSLKLSYYQKWKYNIYTYWHKFFFWFLFKFKKCRQRKVFQTRLLNRIIVSKVVRILRVNHIHLPQGMYKNWVENNRIYFEIPTLLS